MIPNRFNSEKRCFVYCGDERCDCTRSEKSFRAYSPEDEKDVENLRRSHERFTWILIAIALTYVALLLGGLFMLIGG